ncbi:MAG: hypothetical protein IKE50_04935 [Erysipelotrichaceae bacterium]|nr:hypothetical protein [Erysipelotrichaceae bacterium]
MMKKIAKFITIVELIVAVVMYFTVAYHFEHDAMIMKILPGTDFTATLLRLSIYIIPGINIICAFFGIVFSTRGLLSFVGVLEILAGVLTLYFKGKSLMMQNMGILMIVMGLVFIPCVLLYRRDKKEK